MCAACMALNVDASLDQSFVDIAAASGLNVRPP